MKTDKKVLVMLTSDELQFLVTHLPHINKSQGNEQQSNEIIYEWATENEKSFKEAYASLKERAADLQINFEELIKAGIKLNSSFQLN